MFIGTNWMVAISHLGMDGIQLSLSRSYFSNTNWPITEIFKYEWMTNGYWNILKYILYAVLVMFNKL